MSNALDDGALDHGALDQRPLRQRPLDRKNVWCGAPQAHVMFGPRQRRRRVKKVARGKGERSEPAAPGSPKIKLQARRADRNGRRVSVAPPGLARYFQ